MSKLTGGQHIGNVLTTPLGATIRGQYVGAFLEVARMASHIDNGSTYTNGDGSTYDAVRPPGGYGGGYHGAPLLHIVLTAGGYGTAGIIQTTATIYGQYVGGFLEVADGIRQR